MKANSSSLWDFPAAVILTFLVFTAAVRLDATSWTPDLGYVESLAVLGTILGISVGLSRFKKHTMSWLLSLYTLFMIPMHLSRIISGEETAMAQLASLAGRLAASALLLFNGKAVVDHIFFVTLMSILFWVIGIYSGYQLVRDRVIFKVLLPSILPILIIQYYDGIQLDRIWGLAIYFFLALILAGRINLLKSTGRWEKNHIVAGSEPEFDLNQNILVAAAVIIIAAWMLPAPSAVVPAAAKVWRNINEPFGDIRHRLDDMLAALDSHKINNSGELYGNVMGLGRSAGSGDTELFYVDAPPNDLPRLYWRMRIYDNYQNGTWQTTNSKSSPFQPGINDFSSAFKFSSPVKEFMFTWLTSKSSMLVTPSMPVWASRKGSVQTTLRPGGENDPLSWNISPALETGDRYQVRAVLSNPTQKELRQSGSEYPAWVHDQYLQIPRKNSAQVKRLAEQITAELPTNFDKVQAVTEYLRQNIKYSETIPAPPAGADPMNWFLFDWRRGFCNYFATAEVLLLRSIGIPARMVVGFAEGKPDQYGLFHISGKDAHAWPEVYFPKIGWVQFEPTVNQVALVRPSGEATRANDSTNPRDEFAENTRNNSRFDQEKDDYSNESEVSSTTFLGLKRSQWLWVIIPLSVTICLVLLGLKTQRRFLLKNTSKLRHIPATIKKVYAFYNLQSPSWLDRWVRWSEASRAERAFHSINQSLFWLKKPQADNATPAERAQLLKLLLPDASSEIEILCSALETTIYSSHPSDATGILRASWRLRFLTFRQIIEHWLYGA